MKHNLFRQRCENWKTHGQLTAFNLACVAEALDTVKALKDQNIGWETVEQRLGEYKSWDPDIFKVDKDVEDGFRKRLEAHSGPILFVSEEAGKVEINRDKEGGQIIVVSDPFDGSYLFKRGIPDFWYSSMAIYDYKHHPLSCAVGDCVTRKIAFTNEVGAFLADLDDEYLNHEVRLDKQYRQSIGRPDVTEIEDASIESYAMKPKKFLMPLLDAYGDLFLKFKFFLPNGGPYGFVDVAEGKIDCYFAYQQPYVDVFSGISVAEKAHAIVTDFQGEAVKLHEDEKTLWDVVVSTNRSLHEKILTEIEKCHI